ncbi:MAG: RT0821/Lpp0805 family surface protein [Rickettsiaceae bacterium]|nr:RT0821/Lpp0805 family surface protein [Rickettsiaceae bacterium]
MKNTISKVLALLLSAVVFSSCAENGRMSKQGGGVALGALAGGLIGSAFGKGEGKIIAIGAGALLGGLAGGAIGKSLDDRDKMLAERSAQKALESAPSGQSTEWRNPDSGHYGYITPTKTYQAESGRYCREYSHEVRVGRRVEHAYGTACRKPDGDWEIIK